MPVTTTTGLAQLRQDFEDLKLDIEDLLANQNDINEDTRAQLELINQSLAALQKQSLVILLFFPLNLSVSTSERLFCS